MRNIPAESEKTIAEATGKKEEQEKLKVVAEEKLKLVMQSLKEETFGLQQDKEVSLDGRVPLNDLHCQYV